MINTPPADLCQRFGHLWMVRMLSLLLLLMLCTAAKAQITSGTIANGLIYSASNGQITITGYNGSGGALTIPSTILGVTGTVTAIGDSAFKNSTNLTRVTIPNSVSSIGIGAFGVCTGLTHVIIPDGVTSIGIWAFANCTSLTNVTIPGSVTSIGNYAFFGCSSLTSIAVDSRNSVYSSVDGVVFNKNQTTLIMYPPGKGGRYAIPTGVTFIGDVAFIGITSLASVTIPNSVTSIGTYSFASMSLTSITIPNSEVEPKTRTGKC